MKLTQKEIRDLEAAVGNYDTLWNEWCAINGKHSSPNSVYIDANIQNVKTLVERIKGQNTQ